MPDLDRFQSRPFGVALLIAGVDEKGPQLWVPGDHGVLSR